MCQPKTTPYDQNGLREGTQSRPKSRSSLDKWRMGHDSHILWPGKLKSYPNLASKFYLGNFGSSTPTKKSLLLQEK